MKYISHKLFLRPTIKTMVIYNNIYDNNIPINTQYICIYVCIYVIELSTRERERERKRGGERKDIKINKYIAHHVVWTS